MKRNNWTIRMTATLLIMLLVTTTLSGCDFSFREIGENIDIFRQNVNKKIEETKEMIEEILEKTQSEESDSGSLIPILTPTLTPTLTQPQSQTPSQATSTIPSTTVLFGSYEKDNYESNGKESMAWLVLDVDYTQNRMLIISRENLEGVQYNAWTQITWEDSHIRSWLNNEFYNTAFSSTEKARICETALNNPDNPNEGTWGGNITLDKVFLLSIDEVYAYFADDTSRRALNTEYAKAHGVLDESGYGWWWLRSPGSNEIRAARVAPDGSVDEDGILVAMIDVSVRPAMWINFN